MNLIIPNCLVCRDEGMPGGCPKCGKIPERIEVDLDVRTSLGVRKGTDGNSHADDIAWNPEKLIKNHQALVGDTTFERYNAMLTAIYNNIANNSGALPTSSFMIISDRGMGKHAFCYAIIDSLVQAGHTVCPILDHTDYLRLASNPYYKTQSKKYRTTIDDILMCDLFIMNVDSCSPYSAMKAIQSVLDKRGQMGRPTIIISNYALSELITEKTSYIDIRWREGLDKLRYCKMIRC